MKLVRPSCSALATHKFGVGLWSNHMGECPSRFQRKLHLVLNCLNDQTSDGWYELFQIGGFYGAEVYTEELRHFKCSLIQYCECSSWTSNGMPEATFKIGQALPSVLTVEYTAR